MNCLYLKSENEDHFVQVDLVSLDEEASINRQRNDLQDIQAGRSDYAQDIQILGSPKTLEAIGQIQSFEISRGDQSITYEAALFLDGANVLDGYGEFVMTSWVYNKSLECHVGTGFIVSGRALWMSKLNEMKINELPLGSHTKSLTVIQDSWVNDLSYINGVYLPINYGGWSDATNIILRNDIKYSMYVKHILDIALQQIGWTLIGDFANSEKLSKLIMPYSAQDALTGLSQVLSLADPRQRSYSGGNTIGVLPYLFNNINSSQWDNPSEGIWKAQQDQRLSFTYQINAAYVPSTAGTGQLRFKVDSNLRGNLFSSVISLAAGVKTFSNATPFCLQRYEELTFYFEDIDPSDPRKITLTNPSPQLFDISTQPWDTTCAETIVTYHANTLPDYNAGDMMKGVLHALGVIPVTDAYDKTITLVPFDEYYDLEDTEDISDIIDCSEDISEDLTQLICPNKRFRYKEGEGTAIEQYENLFDKVYGSRTDINDESNECLEDEQNPFFHPIWNENTVFYANGASVKGGWWMSTNTRGDGGTPDYNIKPRLAYYWGEANTTIHTYYPQIVWRLEGVALPFNGIFPYGYFIDGLGLTNLFATSDTPNLSYDDEYIYENSGNTNVVVSITPILLRGIVHNRWRTWLDLLRINRFIDATAAMSLLDLLNFDFRIPKAFVSQGHGAGLFLAYSISDWTKEKGKALLSLGLYERNCDDDVCPTLEALGFENQVLHNQDDFAPVPGTNTRMIPIFTDPENQINAITGTYVSVFSTSNTRNLPAPRPYSLVNGVWELPFGFPGNWIHPAGANPFLYEYDAHIWIRELNTFDIDLIDGRQCEYTECDFLVYRGAPYQQATVIREITAGCSPVEFRSWTLDQEQCYQNFIETEFADLAGYNTVLADPRVYSIQALEFDGANLYPFLIGVDSLSYDSSNAAPSQVANDGSTNVSDPATPNNFYAFTRWFNTQFPEGGQNEWPTGTFGNWGSPMFFKQYGSQTAIQYTTEAPWKVQIRKVVSGGSPSSTEYYFEWDGTTLFAASAPTGSPKPTVSNLVTC